MFGGMRGGFLQGKCQGDLGPLRDNRSTQSAPHGLGNARRDWGEPTSSSSSWGGGVAAAAAAATAPAAILPTASTASWGTPSKLPSVIHTTNEDMVSTVTPDDVTMQDNDTTRDQTQKEQQPQSSASGLTGTTGNAAASNTSSSSSSSTNTQHIPLRESFTPLYPYMTSTVPKSALHALYGKAPRRCSLAADLYHTWHDAGPPHTLMWTSLFVCPITAEVFLASVYKAISERTDAYQVKNDLVWFKKKANAEHGAAARAFDCWQYRDLVAADPSIPRHCTLVVNLPENLPYPFSLDFTDKNNKNLPESIPEAIRQKVQEQRAEILQTRSLPMQTEDEVSKEEEEEEPTEMAWQNRPDDHVTMMVEETAASTSAQNGGAGDDNNVDDVFADA